MLLLTVNHNENYQDFRRHKSVYSTETRLVCRCYLVSKQWNMDGNFWSDTISQYYSMHQFGIDLIRIKIDIQYTNQTRTSMYSMQWCSRGRAGDKEGSGSARIFRLPGYQN